MAGKDTNFEFISDEHSYIEKSNPDLPDKLNTREDFTIYTDEGFVIEKVKFSDGNMTRTFRSQVVGKDEYTTNMNKLFDDYYISPSDTVLADSTSVVYDPEVHEDWYDNSSGDYARLSLKRELDPDITVEVWEDTVVNYGDDITITALNGKEIGYVMLEWYRAEDPIWGDPELTQYRELREARGLTEYTFKMDSMFKDIETGSSLTIIAEARDAGAGAEPNLYNLELDNNTEANIEGDLAPDGVLKLNSIQGHLFSGDIKLDVTINEEVTSLSYNKTNNPELFNEYNNEFTLDVSKYQDDEKVEEIKVVASSRKPVYGYTESVYNASSNVKDGIIPNGVLKIEANEGYIIDDGMRIIVDNLGLELSFNKSDNPDNFIDNFKTFVLDVNDYINDPDISSFFVIGDGIEAKEVTYREDLENAQSNIEVREDGLGDIVGLVTKFNTLILTANENHEFTDSIEVRLARTRHPTVVNYYYPNSETDMSYFNEDNTVFTLKLSEDWESDVSLVIVRASAKEIYTGGDGQDPIEGVTSAFANVYSVDNSILSDISTKRWTEIISGVPDGSNLTGDMGAYIYSVYKFPLELDESLISDSKSDIQMGFHKIDTQANYLLRSRIRFDLGTIKVPESYNNIYDYRGVQCMLHVPYSEPIEVPVTYVIDETISLSLFLDLYTGTVTLDIYSSKLDNNLVERIDIPMSYDIPFIQPNYNDVTNELGRYIHNTITRPFIEVIRPIPYDTNTPYGKEGKEYGALGEFQGYIEVADVDLITSATGIEQNRIETLLNGGVVINPTPEQSNNTTK